MRGKTLLLLSIAFWGTAFSAKAQQTMGRIVDEQGEPLGFANVVALSLPDSAFVAGGISREDGTFAFDAGEGDHLLRVTSVGYETYYAPLRPQMGTITLVPFTMQIDEVVVKGNLPKTRMKGDAMVTTVAGTVLEKAGDMNQLLDRIPNVTAQDGDIKVFGRGTPEIYINGRKMNDAMELERLNADNIKNVEVITNPGARYQASVKCVIRITTKRVEGDGFGFEAMARALYNNYSKWDETGRFNFNYRIAGFDLTGTLYMSDYVNADPKHLRQSTYLEDGTIYRQENELYSETHHRNPYGKLALNYMFNPNHSIGMNFSYDYGRNVGAPDENFLDMNSEVYKDELLTEVSRSYLTEIDEHTKNTAKTMHANLYYTGKVGEWGIDFNADWHWQKEDVPQFTKESYQETGQEWQEQNIDTKTLKDSRLLASKLVFTVPLLGGNLGFGGEYSYSRRKNIYTVLPVGILDDDNSRIEEGMASGFLDYSRQMGALSLNAGIRYEHIDFDYYENGQFMDEQSRVFNNVFPSVSLSAHVGGVDMQLGYAIDVERPSYWQLRSSVLYANRYTYETGNPFLTPQKNHNINFGASWKWLNFNVVYTHVKDPILNTSESYKGDSEVTLLKIVNSDAYDQVSASLTLQPRFGIWSPSFTAAVQKQWYDLRIVNGSSMGHPIGTFRFNNTFDTKWLTFSVLMNASTKGDDQNIRVEKAAFRTDISLYRAFLKERLIVQFDARNLFRTSKRCFTMYTMGEGTARAIHMNQYAQRNILLTVRYKFNVAKSKYRGSGAGQEQLRRM